MNSSVYGQSRKSRQDVSYREIEEAAMAILGTGTRPTADNVREHLNGGARITVLNGLKRFWKELGGRVVGLPDSRRRLPAVVAELADGLWQKALNVASESAAGVDGALRAELDQLRLDQDMRAHALAQREIEIESHLRSRERTIRELEQHLRATMALVSNRDATIESLESRLSAALAETETYRQRLVTLVSRTVARRRSSSVQRPRKTHAKSTKVSKPLVRRKRLRGAPKKNRTPVRETMKSRRSRPLRSPR